MAELNNNCGGSTTTTSTNDHGVEELQKAMKIAKHAVSEAASATRFVADTLFLGQSFEDGTIGKLDASPVTVADFSVQAIICLRLQQAFPNDPIIAEEDSKELRKNTQLRNYVVQAVRHVIQLDEESATDNDDDEFGLQVCDWIDRGTHRNYSQRFWTLDPIDGTKGFLRRQQYAICLSLVLDGKPTVGAMACPNLQPALSLRTINIKTGTPKPATSNDNDDDRKKAGTVFCAYLGGGAFQMELLNNDTHRTNHNKGKAAVQTRLQLSERWKETDDSNLRFVESVEAGHSNHTLSSEIASGLNISCPPIRLDSQVKYGVLARGDADIYLRLPRHIKVHDDNGNKILYRENIWDHAAGHIILGEAGGIVTDMDGQSLDYKHGAKLEKNKGIVATVGPQTLHSRVLAVISSCCTR